MYCNVTQTYFNTSNRQKRSIFETVNEDHDVIHVLNISESKIPTAEIRAPL